MSPRTLLSGRNMDYNMHCKLEFGSYVQVHEDNKRTNTVKDRTSGATSLGPVGNSQGGYEFMNISTGAKLTRRNWTEIPMTTEAIDAVVRLGKQQKATRGLQFHDRRGNRIEELHPDDAEIAGVCDLSNADEDDNDSLHNQDEDDCDEDDDAEDDVEYDTEEESVQDLAACDADSNGEEDAAETGEIAQTEDEIEANEVEEPNVEPTVETVEEEPEVPYVTRSGREVNSPKNYVPSMTGKSYEQYFAQIMKHCAHAQCSFKAGLKKHKNKGLTACKEELEQLHLRDTFNPLMPSDMSVEDKKKAFESIIFLKEKRDGRLKARACADGRKQRGEIAKEDAASPTADSYTHLTLPTIQSV